jgi:DNA polymerase elongation subunit (family B)
LSIRGVVLARRDNSLWCRKIYEQVVRSMMDNWSYSEIVAYVNSEILDLMKWDTKCSNINDFIITKLLNDDYKIKELPNDVSKLNKRFADLGINHKITSENQIVEYNNELKKGNACKHETINKYRELCLPAHKQLAIKQGRRGKPEASGSRIEFVYTQNKDSDKLFNKIENPEYFCSFADILRLDRLYYVKSITLCVDQLFTAVFPQYPLHPVSKIYSYHIQHQKVIREIECLLSSQDIQFNVTK